MYKPKLIISGGQAGADRTALEVAKYVLQIPTGGFCPRGCLTEDGPRMELIYEFGLRETESTGYTQRTEANVQIADATVVFGNPYSVGSRQTVQLANGFGKHCWVNPSPVELRGWCELFQVQVLNVAGNRLSKNPKIVDLVTKTLIEAFEG